MKGREGKGKEEDVRGREGLITRIFAFDSF
jgi:hypothetical protein